MFGRFRQVLRRFRGERRGTGGGWTARAGRFHTRPSHAPFPRCGGHPAGLQAGFYRSGVSRERRPWRCAAARGRCTLSPTGPVRTVDVGSDAVSCDGVGRGAPDPLGKRSWDQKFLEFNPVEGQKQPIFNRSENKTSSTARFSEAAAHRPAPCRALAGARSERFSIKQKGREGRCPEHPGAARTHPLVNPCQEILPKHSKRWAM